MAGFKPGVSGNPAGRPKGIKDKRVAAREMFEPHARFLIRKAILMALKGDSTALRICMDRIVPPIKATEALVVLPEANGTLADHGRAVLTAMASGAITPDQGATMMQALSTLGRIVEVEELEKRIAALEQQKGLS